MKIGVAQINSTVGDIAGNAEQILTWVREAEKKECDLVLFPEMVLTGYPPEDLLLKPAFLKDNKIALRDIAPLVKNVDAVIGFCDEKEGRLYNAAAWIQKKKIKTIYHKHCLPNYGVFDEKRYFQPGTEFPTVLLKGFQIGITICEDLWLGPSPLKKLKTKKPDMVLNLSSSPFHVGKFPERVNAVKESAQYLKCPLVYCNLIGGQDELVFDGGSFALNAKGRVSAQCPQFNQGLFVFEATGTKRNIQIKSLEKETIPASETDEILQALILGTKDYVNKNKFEKVALGLSGGIDSALVAAIATQALGPDRVIGVTMPSQFNRTETREDAKTLAKNLGITLFEIPIENVFTAYKETLKPFFKNHPPDLTEENIQARIRGNFLMALSNKFGWLILTTGNKSEMSTGYSTLYGDMAGGFAVLKDVLKTNVFKLSRHINKKAKKTLIPQSIIDRPPTAELRANQKDEDSLGSYSDLDPLIVGYVENNYPLTKLIQKTKASEPYAKRIVGLIDRNEYKRRQSPPGIKITPRSFGRDHRMPITNRYK